MSDDVLTLDTLLGELRHRYRRQVLTFFDEAERDVAHIDELVEHLSVQNDEPSDPEHLTVALHHEVLPALADAGLLEYDPETNTARYRENSRLEGALRLLKELEETS